MGTKMSNAPVFYTLAQVRFNPLSMMSDYVPKIQERLRREGFPDFRTEQLHRIELKQIGGKQPDIQMPVTTLWSFMNSKCTEGYTLQADSIVYHATDYDTFPVFRKKLLKGLKFIHEEVGLDYLDRIGLRYLDLVCPEPDETLNAYLSHSVIGLYQELQGTLAHNFMETVVQNMSGTLVSRVFIRDGALALPPDLRVLKLKVADRFGSFNGLHAILDNDQFTDSRIDFNLDEVSVKLESMHDRVDEAFHKAVMPFALKKWK